MRRTHRIRHVGCIHAAQVVAALLAALWLLGEIEVAWLRTIQP